MKILTDERIARFDGIAHEVPIPIDGLAVKSLCMAAQIALAHMLKEYSLLKSAADALKGTLSEIIEDTGPGPYCEDYEETPNAAWDDVIQEPCGKCKWCKARTALSAYNKLVGKEEGNGTKD